MLRSKNRKVLLCQKDMVQLIMDINIFNIVIISGIGEYPGWVHEVAWHNLLSGYQS